MTSLVAVLALLAVPSTALAGLEAGPIEIGMYGRVGVAWNPQNGQYIHGRYLNLLGNAIGGRLEEGDYLEPTIKVNIVKPTAEDNTKPYFHFVITPSMFSNSGSFLGAFANNFTAQLRIELFQAYLEAGNVLIPELKIWAGQRFYRGGDVHIADYFFFNQLNAQGFGAKYKGLDVAVLLQTGAGLYSARLDDGNAATADPSFQRQRTVFVGQYVLPVMEKHAVHLLGEFHLLPPNRPRIGGEPITPGDVGYVAGAKFRADLGNGSFNELSVRYGARVANGAFSASPTWSTFGRAADNGKFGGAMGLELVEHLLYNVNRMLSVNAYGIFQFSQGAFEGDRLQTVELNEDGTPATNPDGTPRLKTDISNWGRNFAVGARTFLYLSDQFHLINELTFQGFLQQVISGQTLAGMPMATKFTLMPTIAPSGERSAWARPHLRFIYTLAVYNHAAREAGAAGLSVAPYISQFGPRNFAHYLGARAEWWF